MASIRIAGALAALALLPAAAQAQSTITACYVPNTGSVYRIQATGAPAACKSGHVEFSWTTGAPTWGDHVIVSTTFTLSAAQEKDVTVSCPAGRVLVTGGYHISAGTLVTIRRSSPAGQWPGMYWVVRGRNNGGEPGLVYAYAQCAAYTP
jgi:hypothetical protein